MRVVRSPGPAPGATIVAPELSAGDVAKQAQLARKAMELARPLLPGERVDVDVASAAELERLPRVGPSLARRIVEEREAGGPFGSLDGLRRVSGIGPGTLAGFEKTTSFSLQPVPVPRMTEAPGASPPSASRAVMACPSWPISLNAASAAELACLPGVGPVTAERIVTWRTAHGPFREVQMLEGVPGLGPARVARIAAHLRVP